MSPHHKDHTTDRAAAGTAARAARLMVLAVLLAGTVSCARQAPQSAPVSPREHESSTIPPQFLVDPIPHEVAPNEPLLADRVIEYRPVSLAEREGHLLEMTEDLVIAEREGDRRYDFDQAVGLVVDDEGRIYVHDSGRFRIVVYDADGAFVRAYGGAGEMAPFHLGWIAQAGRRLAISTGNKITVWSLSGEHMYDRSLLARAFSRDVQGTTDGALVGSFEMRDRSYRRWYSVEKMSLDEDLSFTYGAVPMPERDRADPPARPGFAATRTGEVYLTRGDEYTVQAFAADGRARWIVHVDWPRSAGDSGPPPPALAVARAARRGPGRGNPVRVDGRGNVYVFPFVDASWSRDEIPVDVYAPDGARIFAGFINERSWLRARGEAVYGIEVGDDGRQRILRYRLAAPITPQP